MMIWKGFVTCAYGVHIVGRVLICYGICDALSSVTFGYLMKVNNLHQGGFQELKGCH